MACGCNEYNEYNEEFSIMCVKMSLFFFPLLSLNKAFGVGVEIGVLHSS